MRNKIILIAAAIIGLALGAGSSLPAVNLSSQVNLNTLEDVVSGYGILLNAENTYMVLLSCKTDTTPHVTKHLCEAPT